MTAWKKHKEYKSFLNDSGYAHPLKNSSFTIGSFKKLPTIFALNPLGGSLVIFTPF
jgi:hypothetical protein